MNYPAAELRGITYGIGPVDSQQAAGNQTRKRLKNTKYLLHQFASYF